MDNSNENKIKHLEFIQLTITRMNVNSFLVKGWLVTLVAAVFVLSDKDANTIFMLFPPFISIVFWGLDGYFIFIERRYRSLYDDVRKLNEEQINYSMDVSSYNDGKNNYLRSVFSLTLLLFYPIVLSAAVLAAAII